MIAALGFGHYFRISFYLISFFFLYVMNNSKRHRRIVVSLGGNPGRVKKGTCYRKDWEPGEEGEVGRGNGGQWNEFWNGLA